MSNLRRLILSTALLVLPVMAPVTFAAASLDDLLESVRTVRAQEDRAFQKNSADFNAAPADQQEKMLQEVHA